MCQLWSSESSTLLYLSSTEHVRSITAEMYAGDAKNLHSPTSGLVALPLGLGQVALVLAVVRHHQGLHFGRVEWLGFEARQQLAVRPVQAY